MNCSQNGPSKGSKQENYNGEGSGVADDHILAGRKGVNKVADNNVQCNCGDEAVVWLGGVTDE